MSMTTSKGSESILSAGLTIEGKIEGNGNIRVAGRFKGNVNVKGELTIEPARPSTARSRRTPCWWAARSAAIHREFPGRVRESARIGDLKAGSLTVAADRRCAARSSSAGRKKSKP